MGLKLGTARPKIGGACPPCAPPRGSAPGVSLSSMRAHVASQSETGSTKSPPGVALVLSYKERVYIGLRPTQLSNNISPTRYTSRYITQHNTTQHNTTRCTWSSRYDTSTCPRRRYWFNRAHLRAHYKILLIGRLSSGMAHPGCIKRGRGK